MQISATLESGLFDKAIAKSGALVPKAWTVFCDYVVDHMAMPDMDGKSCLLHLYIFADCFCSFKR